MQIYYLFASLPFVVSLFWLVIILLNWRENGKHGHYLLFFALVCTILYLCHFIYFSGSSKDKFEWVDSIYTFCNLAVYPLFFVYIKSLTKTESAFERYWWTLIPAAATCLASAILLLAGSKETPVLQITKILFPIEVILVAIFGAKELSGYKKKVENYYADTEGKTLSSLRVLLIFLVVFALLSASANFIGRDQFFGNNSIAIPSIIFSTLLFSVFYNGNRVRFSAYDMEESEITDEEEIQFPDNNDELYEKVVKLMEEEKIFLQPGLKITDLATELGSNRTYLSNCINSKAKMSFSDFIHKYRINYSLEISRKEPGIPIEELAEKSGYQNRTSFYRCFSKIMGCTPTEWIRKNKKCTQ